jgi:hypothetical protein
MGGGLMQLVAYGAQDIYLTGNPQITFFKVVYRRHTNFSMESIEQTFNGTADFGRKVVCTISRNGDLIHRVYLQVTLPGVRTAATKYFRWVNWVGHALVKNVEVEIGGQRIDKHYGDWLHIWNELTQTAGKQAGYANMVGNVDRLFRPVGTFGGKGAGLSTSSIRQAGGAEGEMPAVTLYIPLQFWFCRNPGLALPLIALQYHEVKINLEFRTLAECCGVPDDESPPSVSLSGASLYVDYIYLDTDERRRFAQVSHEYLIEQLQFTGDESVTSPNNKIKLNFNHPCKELVWVTQLDNCVNLNKLDTTSAINGRQWFNYTDMVDKTPYRQQDALVLNDILDGIINTSPGAAGEATSAYNQNFGLGPAGAASAGGSSDASGTGQGLLSSQNAAYDQGENPTVNAKLQLNGHDRFSQRDGRYFNLVQPFQHHERVPSTGINVYSFGLKPEEHQPSGTCNMSRIDNATLHLTLSSLIKSDNAAKVRVYATNYNVLRIMSGMGGLAYSN